MKYFNDNYLMVGCETEDVIKQKYEFEKDLMNLYVINDNFNKECKDRLILRYWG